MSTAVWSAGTIPVNSAAVSATVSERTPMMSISRATSQKYEGGSVRFRATRTVSSPRPPYHTADSRRCRRRSWTIIEAPPARSSRPGPGRRAGPRRTPRSAPRTGSRARTARPRRPEPPPRPGGLLLDRPPQGEAARAQQHRGGEPQVRDFGHDARGALAAERRRHPLGRLLADLPADLGLALLEERGHVRAGRRSHLARFEHALEDLQHGRTGAAGGGLPLALVEAREEAAPRPGVAGHAVPMHLDQQRVTVAVDVDAVHVLGVTGRLPLAPERPARARPEVGETGPARRLKRVPAHPRHHEDLARLGVLHDGGDQPPPLPCELLAPAHRSRP